MVPTVILAAVAPLLLLAVLAVALRLSAAVAVRVDARRGMLAPAAPVAELPRGGPPSEIVYVEAVAPVQPGPLQLVDDPTPSTKRCPACAEAVLASAPVCKHCRRPLGPPVPGTYAV